MSTAVLNSIPAAKSKPGRDYLALVERFPLRSVHDDREHKAALDVLDKLVGHPHLSKGEAEYLEALTELVGSYEDDYALESDDPVSPVEMLRALMEHRGMTQAELSELLGSESAASMILNAKREISKPQAKLLAKHFRVDAGVFI
jgi:HTH-type transcriptional regulator / antitoxin HigA